MIRKFLLMLEAGLLLAGLLVAFAGWQQSVTLEQPLNISAERMLDVPAGATPGGLLNRLEEEGC